MKRLFALFFTVIVGVNLFAQQDVTKFLGIPVDGFKPAMIQKLKAKGFVSTSYDKDVLEGEFNGEEVTLHVVTNNNKVYRIAVCDKTLRNETDIRIRFNKLVNQFKNNPKYLNVSEDNFIIPETEDISYNIGIRNKRYEASFVQKPEIIDTASVFVNFFESLKNEYSAEELEQLNEGQETEFYQKFIEKLAIEMAAVSLKKPVWFMINKEKYGKYSITIFYDNEYNHANGEDL